VFSQSTKENKFFAYCSEQHKEEDALKRKKNKK
jgi:hypothetical protein